MTLRRQLLIIVMMTLSLPWAGCQYARHIEGVLRDTQIDTLKVLATSAVAQLSPQLPPTSSEPVAVYAFALNAAPILDGYDDEWQPLLAARKTANPIDPGSYANDQANSEIIAGIYRSALYLFIKITDTNIVYFNPTLNGANGDRLILRLGNIDSGTQDILLSTSAPGNITNSAMQQQGIQAYLQENDTGYQIELLLPLSKLLDTVSATSKLRITRFDTDTDSEQKQTLVSGRVLLPDKNLHGLLSYYADRSRRIQLVDQDGWIIASAGSLNNAFSNANVFLNNNDFDTEQDTEQDGLDEDKLWSQLWSSIRLQLYRWMLSGDRESRRSNNSSSYPDRSSGKYQSAFIARVLAGESLGLWQQRHLGEAYAIAAVPIPDNSRLENSTQDKTTLDTARQENANIDHTGDAKNPVKGAIIIEQANDAILSTGNSAISKLFNVSFVAIAMITIALLIFASLLSWRIKRLANAASTIINSDGEFIPQIQQSSVKDEIGDLYRSIATLQQRIESYTNYLKSLAAKLSHELRTPLAMVSTSLENLQQTQQINKEALVYMQRANDGILRLRQLVNAMSAATHVEQSISSAEKEHFDLAGLLQNLTDSYQSLGHDKLVQVEINEAPLQCYGAPELIAQLIDKLWDNALEFTPPEGKIRFELTASKQEILLSVSNEGPLLPEGMQKQLFDSLVSIREHKSDQAHLGLGLHIARLIAEFHHGSLQANNLADRTGVSFTLKLPR